MKKIEEGDKYYKELGKILLGYIVSGIKKDYVDKYDTNVSSGSIQDYDIWSYLEKNILQTYGIEAPDVAVLSINPQVRDIYGLPNTAEAMYIPDIKAIIVQDKDYNEHIFNGTMVHEYTHYMQDVIGLFSQSIYSILCPKCDSVDVTIEEVGRNILGVSNSIGNNVRRSSEKEEDHFSKKKIGNSENKISDYMFVNNGLLWMENKGWQSEGIPSVGYRLYRKFYYSQKFDKIIPDSTRMDQKSFLIEVFVTPQRKIESFNFYIEDENIQEDEAIVLEEENLSLYINLLEDVLGDDLTKNSINQIIKAVQFCVLNQGCGVDKTYKVYQGNYNNTDVKKDHIEEAINLLGYQTPNKYQCKQCNHRFEQIPLSKEDAQNIMDIVNKFYYGHGMSAENISKSTGSVIPSSFFDRAIETIEFNRLDYYERPPEIMAFSEQFKYLKSIQENGQPKYSNKHIFDAYKKYFIQRTSEDILPKDVKEAMLLIQDLDFSNMFWRDMTVYKNEEFTEDKKKKKEKIEKKVNEYKDYYSKEKRIISKSKNHRTVEALEYLENLYALIVNGDTLFYS